MKRQTIMIAIIAIIIIASAIAVTYQPKRNNHNIAIDSCTPIPQQIILDDVFPEATPNTSPVMQNSVSYLIANEITVNGISEKTTREQLIKKLGQPQRIEYEEEGTDEIYNYGNVKYSFYSYGEYQQYVQYAEIIGRMNQTPRNIQVGDKFQDVLNKFPQEKDYQKNEYGIFYGDAPSSPEGSSFGLVDDTFDYGKPTISLVSEKSRPMLKVHFENGTVKWMQIFYTL